MDVSTLLRYWNHAFFCHVNIWAALCKYFHMVKWTCEGVFEWAVLGGRSLNFDKAYLCSFETLAFVHI